MAEVKKMFSAFISSAYSSLKSQRDEVINSLLDYRVFPICMEHFTVSSDNNFSDITALIDESDIFILLLGKEYGTTDTNGKSITQNEYEYAVKKGLKIIAIITEELSDYLNKSDSEKAKLSDDERKQIEFASSISYAKRQSPTCSISRIITQFFGNFDLESCAGWIRNETDDSEFNLTHKVFDLNGKWYHVHFSSDDPSYIRIGFFEIKQNFNKDEYTRLKFNGSNFTIRYNKETKTYKENILKSTIWSGNYLLDNDGTIQGIFEARRTYTDNFNNVIVTKGIRRGIHDFQIDLENEETTSLMGSFHDEAPSPKMGRIMAFKSKEERDEFIKENLLESYLETLEN